MKICRKSRSLFQVKIRWAIILMTPLLLSPAWAETGITNTINGVNTNAGATFTIGNTGPFNALIITNAGSVSNGVGIIGSTAAGSNNSVLVTDPGSAWTNIGSLTIGASASANQLIITNGGFVKSTTADIGKVGNKNSVMVTGSNSV